MRVLATSSTTSDEDKQAAEAQQQKAAQEKEAQKQQQQTRGVGGARRAILRALGVKTLAAEAKTQDVKAKAAPSVQAETGLESAVLGRMEGQDFGDQMQEFYTAYSKAGSACPDPLC